MSSPRDALPWYEKYNQIVIVGSAVLILVGAVVVIFIWQRQGYGLRCHNCCARYFCPCIGPVYELHMNGGETVNHPQRCDMRSSDEDSDNNGDDNDGGEGNHDADHNRANYDEGNGHNVDGAVNND